ncbi:MAG: elongation factor G [Oscillospiraceae bacterium]|nr:elongation factor G [Oscillospiraceae bacterium]
MKAYTSNNIRNIAVLGHGGKGKTTLCEALLYISGASDRLGKVADGNTVLDFDAEEKRRKSSVSSAMAAIEWDNTKLNIIDAPGLFDFENGSAEAVRAAEAVLIVTSAGSGIDVGTEKAFKAADKRGLSKIFAITKTDSDHRSFYKTFDALKAAYGSSLCPTVIPYMEGNITKCYVNLITGTAFEYKDGKATSVPVPSDPVIEDMTAVFMEAVASTDDELMEKFFEGDSFTKEEILRGLNAGIADGSIYPVYAVSGLTCAAVDQLLNGLAWSAPCCTGETAKNSNGDDVKLACDVNAPLAAVCFKTVADPFVGKMSFFKVVSGKLSGDTQGYNVRTGETEKMGKIVTVKGAKQEDAKEIVAGDIGVVTKLAGVKTGDTICDGKNVVTLDGVDCPKSCLSMAVKVRKKGEEEKVAQGLVRLMEEDPSITFATNKETKEQVLSGMGEQHLDVIVSKLKNKFGVEVDLTVPKVAYRETIRKTAEAQGKHKKQSGGHGQYGDVWVRFEPCDSETLIFAEEVFGGAVPKNFFPAVEKGLRDCVTKGVLAGYPMVGVKATLYDGSYHPVDSSEMAFKTAASLAYKAAIPKADPTILEPVGTLTVLMPDDNLGDIMGDITKRRGRVLGMGPANEPKMQELTAEVPMAEMGDFTTVLRSVTAGRGSFSFEFTRYEQAPQNVVEKVIAESATEE